MDFRAGACFSALGNIDPGFRRGVLRGFGSHRHSLNAVSSHTELRVGGALVLAWSGKVEERQ